MGLHLYLVPLLSIIIIILTFSHNLQRSNYQAIVNLAFDSLYEPLIFHRVLGHMHQHLSKCETSNRKGMNEQRARDELVTLEQLQQLLAVLESPARPEELFDLWLKQTQCSCLIFWTQSNFQMPPTRSETVGPEPLWNI